MTNHHIPSEKLIIEPDRRREQWSVDNATDELECRKTPGKFEGFNGG